MSINPTIVAVAAGAASIGITVGVILGRDDRRAWRARQALTLLRYQKAAEWIIAEAQWWAADWRDLYHDDIWDPYRQGEFSTENHDLPWEAES